MLFFPQTYQWIKYPLLGVSILIIFIKRGMSIVYSKKLILWFVFLFYFYFTWIFIGYLYGNPGIWDDSRVFLIWPFIYLILILYIDSQRVVYSIFKLLIFITFLISIYNIYAVLITLNIAPKLFQLNDGTEATGIAVGIHHGYTQIVTLNIGSLVFLLPFSIGALVAKKSFFQETKISKGFLQLTAFLTILCSLLSGRRILWLLILFSLGLNIFMLFRKKDWSQLKKLLVWSSLFFMMLIIINNQTFKLSFSVMTSRIAEELNPNNPTPRNLQKIALLKGFYKYPLLGSGLGKGVREVVRNEKRPWTYELTYNLYLYNTGLLGILIFFILLLFPIIWGFKLTNNSPQYFNIIYPIIIGYVGALIGSATNPYFTSSFDFLWMLFLPVGVLNYLELISTNK